jgi:hypothetical protein
MDLSIFSCKYTKKASIIKKLTSVISLVLQAVVASDFTLDSQSFQEGEEEVRLLQLTLLAVAVTVDSQDLASWGPMMQNITIRCSK